MRSHHDWRQSCKNIPEFGLNSVILSSWDENCYGACTLLFIQTRLDFTLPTFIATLITEAETFRGRLMGIGLIASLPILLMLALFQKHLVRGWPVA